MSGTNTLDGMTVAQLRDLATRAENAAKQQEEESDKYTVSAAVEIESTGTLVCAAKDGTLWLTVRGGHWVEVRAFEYPMAGYLLKNGVFPYAYGSYTAFCAAPRPTYSGQALK